MKILLPALLMSCCLGLIQAESFTPTYTITKGSNGEATFTTSATAGDIIVVTFVAQSPYIMESATVEDPAKLGWKPNGGFSFKLIVPKGLDITKEHSAKFKGTLTVKGTSDKKPEPIPWDMDGKFKVLGAHQGVGHDQSRDPPATMTSDKPGNAPTTSGQATYNPATGQFTGSFIEDGQNFTGIFEGVVVADKATKEPKELIVQSDPCPDGDGVMVKFVYFGCTDEGGIAGKAVPDNIKINGFTQNPSAAEARAKATKATADRVAAEAKAAKALTKSQKADADVVKAEADVQKAIANVPAVKQAEAKLKAAQTRVAQVEKAKAPIDAEWALVQQLVAQGKLGVSNARYRNAQTAATQAAAVLTKAQADLAAAQEALNKAKADAPNDPTVKAAHAKLDAAKAAAAQAKADYDAAKAAADTAATAEAAALAEAERLEAIQTAWEQVYDGTLLHEQGHRKICHFYTDKMTEMLNALRVWGYAVQEATARALGKAHFKVIWNQEVAKISKEAEDKQKEYDSPGGSDHGRNQDNWNWNRLP